MAFDGIMTRAVALELQEKLTLGKIEKVYQPEADELIFSIYTKQGNVKLYASANSSSARVHLIKENIPSPPAPPSFCMLLRKHLQGARITEVSQKDCERILEISMETLNELGFTVSKKLIFEIMGKHSNIILVDLATNKIIDSIKRVSIDVNRVRQILPGLEYQYPPAQDKIPFDELTEEAISNLPSLDGKTLQRSVGGIAPSFAEEMALHQDICGYVDSVLASLRMGTSVPRVYTDDKEIPKEFYITNLYEYETACQKIEFDSLSQCLEHYYGNKKSSNRVHQKSSDLIRAVSSLLDKLHLKEQRLN